MNNIEKHNNGSADHHTDNEGNTAPETIVIKHVIMLCSLAVSDFLVGLIAQPIFIAKELLKEDRYVNHISDMMGYSLCGVSFLTIIAITVDRFLALHYRMRHATLVNEFLVKYTLIII